MQSSECISAPVDKNCDGRHDAKCRDKFNERPNADLIARSMVDER